MREQFDKIAETCHKADKVLRDAARNGRDQGAGPVRTWNLMLKEPSLEELLGDEMMSVVIRSAGLDPMSLRAMLADVAGRMSFKPRSECSVEGDCQPSGA
jgi:hypothetical protein